MAAHDNGGIDPTPAQVGALRVGCAGLGQSTWVGDLYPRRTKSTDFLDLYQEHFDFVEINSSFYGLPSLATIGSWHSRCARRFELGLKAPGAITHDGGLSDGVLDRVRALLVAAEHLGEAAGPILFQCPRTLTADVSRLHALEPVLSARAGERPRIVFEFRHSSWFEDEAVLAFMRVHNWALCCHPNSVGRATVGRQGEGRDGSSASYELEALQPVVTADFAYVRLHGRNDEHTYRYTDTELAQYAAQLHELRTRGLDVYVSILNDTGERPCAMHANARRLRALTHALAGESVPRAPKEARKKIGDFFARAPSSSKRPRDESAAAGAGAEP